MRQKINDGLTRTQRHRLKDINAYRKRKREYVKTDRQRKMQREWQRRWREKNREKHNALAKIYYQKHKHKHKDRFRNYHLLTKYGITLEDKIKMESEQNGRCLICGRDKSLIARKVFHVDHCHITGRVRGLLCSICNGNLGWYEKNKLSIEKYMK